MRRALRPAAALAALASLAACAGPHRPLEFGIKEISSDLILGRQGAAVLPAPAPVPVPPVAFVFSPSGLVGPSSPMRPATPVAAPPTTQPPSSCPTADPLAPTQVPARNAVTTLPAEATYVYRVEGTYSVGGANASSGTLPPLSTRRVSDVHQLSDGSVNFIVEARLGDTVTDTTYHVIPTTTLAPQAGIFVHAVRTSDSDGSSAFTPTSELLLLPFPADPGATFSAAGTDGPTTMQWDGAIGQKARVDACGTPIDAVSVRIRGTVSTAGARSVTQNIDAVYAIATQFGGISVMDTVNLDGTVVESGAAFSASRHLQATINSEPK